jgi:hypothetical protein
MLGLQFFQGDKAMKKKLNRLTLRKITVADVSPDQLAQVGGGILPWTRHSVCAEQSCETDRTANCPRTM